MQKRVLMTPFNYGNKVYKAEGANKLKQSIKRTNKTSSNFISFSFATIMQTIIYEIVNLLVLIENLHALTSHKLK